MNGHWYYTLDPLAVTQKWPGPQAQVYATFRGARRGLMEDLQNHARMYLELYQRKLRQVVEVAHLEEPS
jgi:hypothetical protein